ncbi:MAG: RNA polymerase sigma factor [Firmicutes bacterium]|nr:RNA polymerase sigma factor [Bacillota bacterium]
MNDFFEQIYYEYKDDVYRLALSYTQNKYDAEDIVQRTFIKVYKKIQNIQNDNIKKYLLTITANECKDLFKSFWRRNTDSIFDNEIKEFKYDVKKLELLEMLKTLPKKYRICIHLHYFYGYSIKEIASIENINENTAKTRLARARNLLKIELGRNELYEENI